MKDVIFSFAKFSQDTLDKHLLMSGKLKTMLETFLAGSVERVTWNWINKIQKAQYSLILLVMLPTSLYAAGKSSIVRYYSMSKIELWVLRRLTVTMETESIVTV